MVAVTVTGQLTLTNSVAATVLELNYRSKGSTNGQNCYFFKVSKMEKAL
jgi:hypothetical protein